MMLQRNVEEGSLRLETDFPSGSPSLWHSLLSMCLYLDVSEGVGNNPLRDYLRLLDDNYISIFNVNSIFKYYNCYLFYGCFYQCNSYVVKMFGIGKVGNIYI